jgi:FKBP-type peptidyl-prolyl cis-trans isomerase
MSPNSFRPIVLLSLVLLGLGAVPLHAQREKLPMADLEVVEKRWPDAKRTYTGLRYVVLQPATDPKSTPPAEGTKCTVLYKGMLLDGTVFDASPNRETPLVARIGRGELIQGWDEALQRMRRGEKWLLIVPPEMAYGSRGRPPTIGRNATLVFEMELVDFEKK